MSKTAKILVAVLIICILAAAGGLYASKPLMEQAVRDALHRAGSDAGVCSVDTVEVNPLTFNLKLGNLRFSDKQTFDLDMKELSLNVSPRFVLACVPALRDTFLPASGDVTLITSAEGRDLTQRALIPGESMTCKTEAISLGSMALDAGVLKRLLNREKVPGDEFMLAVIAEKITYGPASVYGKDRKGQDKKLLTVARVSIEGVDRRNWKRMVFDDSVFDFEPEFGFTMGSLEIRDLFLPDGDWFKRFLELTRSADAGKISEEEFQSALENLFLTLVRPQKDATGKQTGKPPFGSLQVKDVDVIDLPGKDASMFHLSEMSFDWLGIAPHHFKSKLSCALPAKTFRSLVRIPGKDRLVLHLQDENIEKTGEPGGDYYRQTGRLRLEGLADLDYAYNFFCDDPNMFDAAFSDLSLDLHDHGLTAVLAYNIDPRPEAMATMMPLLGASLCKDFDDLKDAQAIQTFLNQPGTLSIRSEDPARRIPWLQFLDAAALGRALVFTATPGEKSLVEQMKALSAQ